MNDKNLFLASSPHFKLKITTPMIMGTVLFALLPECIFGVVTFGLRALVTILVSVLSCVIFEFLFQFFTKQRITISNLSACVSGVMLALVCPPTIPVWMVVLGAAVAMIVAKGLFGGIGSNVFNPALAGRAVLMISFPAAMGARWLNPVSLVADGSVDAMSSATILSSIKNGSVKAEDFDFVTYFFGNHSGCIGETSALLILISFAILLLCRIIDWRAPVAMVGTVSLASFFAGLIRTGSFYGACQELLMNVLTGGLLFGATFMVTDYATSPVTKPGRFVFGLGCGLITFLIRTFGGYPEGVMFSILIMNTIVPFLNNLTVRKYGYGKKGNKRPDIKKIQMEFDLSSISEEQIKGGQNV